MSTAMLQGWAQRHKRVLKDWFDASPNYRPWPLLNALGLQTARMVLSRARYALRPRHNHPELASHELALDREGFVKIERFLTPDIFAAVEAAFDSIGRSDYVICEKNKNDTAVDWYTCGLDPKEPRNDAEQVILDALAKNATVLKLVEHVLRRRIPSFPVLSYQRLKVENGLSDDKDVEGILHSDRHYPCVKAVFYVNDNLERNGAFVYCPHSHRLTGARLRHEREYSEREALYLLNRSGSIDPVLLERGRNRISDRSAREMKVRPVSIEGPKNTLVISNNSGFHKRGRIQPNEERKQIRFLFYYAQRPWYGDLAHRIFGRL